jgi:methyltransferase
MRYIIISLTFGWFVMVLINLRQLELFPGVFILMVAAERFWETFFTSKQNIFDKKAAFDWLFKVLTYYYIAIMYGTVIEYISLRRATYLPLLILGLIGFFTALILRLWAIKMFGGKWNTCVLGRISRKFRPKKLIRRGPYRLIRHPIYLGGILEALSIPAIFNSYYTLVFAALAYLPLMVLRAYLEENELMKIFGTGYLRYQHKTIGF